MRGPVELNPMDQSILEYSTQNTDTGIVQVCKNLEWEEEKARVVSS